MKLAVEELPPAAVAAVVNPTPHTVTRRGRACRCVPRMNTAPRVDKKKDHRKQSKTEQTELTLQTVPAVPAVPAVLPAPAVQVVTTAPAEPAAQAERGSGSRATGATCPLWL